MDVETSISWPAVALGVGMGLWVALVFALLPAARRPADPAAGRAAPGLRSREPRPRDSWRWPALALLVASTVGLAALQVGNRRQGAIFAGGDRRSRCWCSGLAAWVLVRPLRRWFPARLPYLWRQGLANLYRPANQTVVVVLALGFGAFLLGTLYLVQLNLLREFRLRPAGPRAQPGAVRHSARSARRDRARAARGGADRRAGGADRADADRVGEGTAGAAGSWPTRTADADGQPLGRWAFRREYRSTYRDTFVASEKRLVGDWWQPRTASDRRAGPASRSRVELAGELGVTVGDDDRLGRAGHSGHDPGGQPPGSGLGPLRAQLLRGLPAGAAGRRAPDVGDAHPDRATRASGARSAAGGGAVAQRHLARSHRWSRRRSRG